MCHRGNEALMYGTIQWRLPSSVLLGGTRQKLSLNFSHIVIAERKAISCHWWRNETATQNFWVTIYCSIYSQKESLHFKKLNLPHSFRSFHFVCYWGGLTAFSKAVFFTLWKAEACQGGPLSSEKNNNMLSKALPDLHRNGTLFAAFKPFSQKLNNRQKGARVPCIAVGVWVGVDQSHNRMLQ